MRKKTRNSYRNKSDLRSESGAKPKKEKKRHLENQKEKFRKSKEWKDFRSKMAIQFNHRDYITGKRLIKGFNLHHLKTEQTSESYCDISHENEFIPLNSYCHKLLHYLFTYYQKDKDIIKRLVEVLDTMCDLSPKDGEIVDDPQSEEENKGGLFIAGEDEGDVDAQLKLDSDDPYEYIDEDGVKHTYMDFVDSSEGSYELVESSDEVNGAEEQQQPLQ